MDDQIVPYKIGDLINLNQACQFSLLLAQKGLGKVEPNPCVGAVLFDESKNKLISFGFHKSFGAAHAEVNALKNIENAKGLTLVVSLEPCSHFGKTPPCAHLIVEKKVSKIVYLSEDPNPKVGGEGIRYLKEHGVEVDYGGFDFDKKNKELNDKFFYAFENKRSFVHLKWAESKDGKLALPGENIQITDKETQLQAHFLRAQSDAILVGRNTVEVDNPRLDVRLPGYEKTMKVLIMDTELKLLEKIKKTKIYKTHGEKSIYFITNKEVKGFNKIEYGAGNLIDLTQKTFNVGIQSIFVEGGPYTLSQFLNQGVYNRKTVFVGEALLGEKGISLTLG